jgi:hypothetical protein
MEDYAQPVAADVTPLELKVLDTARGNINAKEIRDGFDAVLFLGSGDKDNF